MDALTSINDLIDSAADAASERERGSAEQDKRRAENRAVIREKGRAIWEELVSRTESAIERFNNHLDPVSEQRFQFAREQNAFTLERKFFPAIRLRALYHENWTPVVYELSIAEGQGVPMKTKQQGGFFLHLDSRDNIHFMGDGKEMDAEDVAGFLLRLVLTS